MTAIKVGCCYLTEPRGGGLPLEDPNNKGWKRDLIVRRDGELREVEP